MRTLYSSLLFPLALSLVAVAGTPRKVLILEANGPAGRLVSKKVSSKINTGTILQPGDVVELQAGGSLTALVLGKRERVRVTGPSRLTVNGDGLQSAGGTVEALESPEPQLALTGDNHRRLSGVRTRASLVQPGPTVVDRLSVTPGTPSMLNFSMPASSMAARPVKVAFYPYFTGPSIDAQGISREEPEAMLQSVTVTPRLEDGRVFYSTPLPAEPTELTVRILDDAKELVYTRVRTLSDTENTELQQARDSAEKWAARQPSSAEPWILYAYALEEKGLLWQAREAIAKALQVRPSDPGLLETKLRLELDSGDYTAALATWKTWKPE